MILMLFYAGFMVLRWCPNAMKREELWESVQIIYIYIKPLILLKEFTRCLNHTAYIGKFKWGCQSFRTRMQACLCRFSANQVVALLSATNEGS